MKSKEYIENMLTDAYSELENTKAEAQHAYDEWISNRHDYGAADDTEMNTVYEKIAILEDRIEMLREILID